MTDLPDDRRFELFPGPPDVPKQDPDAPEPSNPTDEPKEDDYPDG